MRSVFHWDFVQGLRRLPMPTGWRGLQNQQQPMLCPFSENRCWMRQGMGKKTLKLSQRKGNFFLITAQKTQGEAVFPFSFLCFLLLFQTGLKLVRLRAISYLPGRPQLWVRSSHHGSATNSFPSNYFCPVFYSPCQKAKKSFKHLTGMPPPKKNDPEKLQFRINKASGLFCRGVLSPISRREFFIYQAAEREGLSIRWFWNSWSKVNLVFNFKVQKILEAESIQG